MSRDRFVLYTLLGLILVAVLGLAFIKSVQKHPAGDTVYPSPRAERARSIATEPEYDFTTLLPDDTASSIAARPQENSPTTYVPSDAVAPIRSSQGPEAVRVESVSVKHTAPSATGFFRPSVKTAPSSKNFLAANARPTRSYAGNSGIKDTVPYSYEGGTTQPTGRPSQGTQILDAYTPQQTAKQQKALDQKLQAMSDGLERAIAQAMAPKSRREQNLEKYMPSATAGAAASAAATANASGTSEVSQQLASQARQVVGDMRRNYGDRAAGQASEIMNDFQQEMASVLNGPADPQEKQIQAQEINNKYNEKLRKLNDNQAREKLVNQLRQENEKKLAKIGQTFNESTATAARAKMEEYVQKRADIMTAGYSEEEAYKRLLALEDQQQKDLEQIIKQANPDDVAVASKLVALENEQARERLQQDQQDLQEGRKNAKMVRYGEQTVEEYKKSWQKENQNIVEGMQIYGPEVQARAQQILNQATQQRAQILAEGGTEVEVQQKLIETTEQTNALLTKLRQDNQQVKVQNIERELNERNTSVLQEYANQLQGASEQTKEAWIQQGRVVLEKYNKSRAQLVAEAETNPHYKRDMQRLDTALWQELQQIQVPAR